jgi:O-acetyl-ADP-ribose deacetylase (regulator of RNase III)
VIELVLGDITEQDVDAVVNAANSTLLGGGGVDAAIHRAGGPSILEECRRLGGCAPGEVKPTGAGRLRARHVLHAVGPVWRGGGANEAQLLAACHRRAVELAAELGDRTLAFPAISTGAYAYPVELAAPVALRATDEALRAHPQVEFARFVFRDEATLHHYEAALRNLPK